MKKILCLFAAVVFVFSITLTAFAEGHPSLLVDGAEILSADEYASMLADLTAISDELKTDIAIVTFDDLQYMSDDEIVEFCDDYYDQNGYGYGGTEDGVLLVLSVGEPDSRFYYVTSGGDTQGAVAYEESQYIGGLMVNDLKLGNYADAMKTYINAVYGMISAYQNGELYTDQNGETLVDPDIDFDQYGAAEHMTVKQKIQSMFGSFGAIIKRLVACLIVGFVVALIASSKMKNDLTNYVRMQRSATDYTVPGSLSLRDKREQFLYSNVVKTPRATESSDSSGRSGSGIGSSGSHTSSSGSSHSGGGGRF